MLVVFQESSDQAGFPICVPDHVVDCSEVLERSGAGHFVEQEPQVVAFSRPGTDSIYSTNGMNPPSVVNLILPVYQLYSLASLPLLGALVTGVVLGQLGILNGLCKVVFGAEFKEGCEGSCWGGPCALSSAFASVNITLCPFSRCMPGRPRAGSAHEWGVLGCAMLPRCCPHTWHSETGRSRPLPWAGLAALGCPLARYAAVRTPPGPFPSYVFEDVLDAFDTTADIYVDVAVELAQQEGIVWHHPLVGDLLLYLLAILSHIYSACAAAVIWLAGTVFWVAFVSLLCALEELLGETLGALSVDHAGRVPV